jgi:hypothetical protein
MTDDTRRVLRLIIDALAAGGVGMGGALLAAKTSAGAIPESAWVIGAIVGGVTVCQSVRSSLSQPPSHHTTPSQT